jgi:hypothetical protein
VAICGGLGISVIILVPLSIALRWHITPELRGRDVRSGPSQMIGCASITKILIRVQSYQLFLEKLLSK